MMPPNLPKRLQHLQVYFEETSALYKTALWLVSDFDAPVWEVRLAHVGSQFINWDVQLDDGTSLVDPGNKDLLSGLKQYLILVTRNNSDLVAETNSERSQRNSFNHAGHIIDYLLLHSDRFKLGKLGLEGLYANRLTSILKKVADTRDVHEFFDWEPLVAAFARSLTGSTPIETINQVMEEIPQIMLITPEQLEANQLGIPKEELPMVRAVLLYHGYMLKNKGWRLDTVKIAAHIYKNTIFAKFTKRARIESLEFGTNAESTKEYPAAPITTFNENGVLPARYATYKQLIYMLGALHEVGIPAPSIEDLNEALSYEASLGREGRFRTLPSAVALRALKDAIEFHLQHGKHIVDSFCLLAIHCTYNKMPVKDFQGSALASIIRKQTTAFGVSAPTISTKFLKHNRQRYFEALRSNNGLTELVRIYIGCVQVVVGALMGRRSGELIDLRTLSCLDSTESWLQFLNRKSSKGARGLRRLEGRPIEPIAVQMIKALVRMQKILKRIGFIEEIEYLFSSPAVRGRETFRSANRDTFNANLNLFCDYFQTALNKNNERYYIRQHQFRRFFALLFFHTNSFGGLETLQWMFAHNDISHVWNYITTNVDGAVLVGAKAQYISENLQSYENLANLMKERYGATNFMLADTDELEEKIANLIDDGTITVEADIFEDELGKQLRIVVKVIGEDE